MNNDKPMHNRHAAPHRREWMCVFMRSGNNFSQFFRQKFDLLIDAGNIEDTKAKIAKPELC